MLEKMDFPRAGHFGGRRAEDRCRPGKNGHGAAASGAEKILRSACHTDQESGQTIIAGMGELHLEIIVDRMKREFKVEANVGKPQVAYRETIRAKVEQEGKFVRQSGGRGQYGHVWITLEPAEAGKGFEFVNGIVGGTVPKEYIPAVEKGSKKRRKAACSPAIRSSMSKSTLFDGSYHDVDSNEMAFKIAGSMAFRDAMSNAKPVIARADHEGRGRDAGRLLRRHRRRFESSPRSDRRHGRFGFGQGRHCRSAARGNVSVLDRPCAR